MLWWEWERGKRERERESERKKKLIFFSSHLSSSHLLKHTPIPQYLSFFFLPPLPTLIDGFKATCPIFKWAMTLNSNPLFPLLPHTLHTKHIFFFFTPNEKPHIYIYILKEPKPQRNHHKTHLLRGGMRWDEVRWDNPYIYIYIMEQQEVKKKTG